MEWMHQGVALMPEPKTVIRIEPTLPVAREEVMPSGRDTRYPILCNAAGVGC